MVCVPPTPRGVMRHAAAAAAAGLRGLSSAALVARLWKVLQVQPRRPGQTRADDGLLPQHTVDITAGNDKHKLQAVEKTLTCRSLALWLRLSFKMFTSESGCSDGYCSDAYLK